MLLVQLNRLGSSHAGCWWTWGDPRVEERGLSLLLARLKVKKLISALGTNLYIIYIVHFHCKHWLSGWGCYATDIICGFRRLWFSNLPSSTCFKEGRRDCDHIALGRAWHKDLKNYDLFLYICKNNWNNPPMLCSNFWINYSFVHVCGVGETPHLRFHTGFFPRKWVQEIDLGVHAADKASSVVPIRKGARGEPC